MKPQLLSPREARTFKQVCSLQTDNHQVKTGWIMNTGDEVCLYNQRNGEASTGEVHFSYGDFHRLIDWYNRKQKTRREAV